MTEEVKTEGTEEVKKDGAEAQTQEGGERQYTEQEQSAMLLGWKPEDQYDGPEGEFRSAREFLERGEMIGKIRALSKQNSEITRAIKHMSAQNQKLYDNGYQAALRDLKAQKREALSENDLVKAEEIQEKIDEVKEKQAQNKQSAMPAVSEVDPEHEAWVAENQWYATNPVLHNFADSLAVEYVRVNQGQVTAADVRDYVAKTVKAEFAHRLQPKVTGAPSPDGAGRRPNSKPGSSTNQLSTLKAGMTEQELGIMKTVIKTTGMSEQEYLKQYATA